MLETQRNEYASGLIEIGNQAEARIREQELQYSEEVQRIKHQAEAYVGNQSEDIARLRHELMVANAEAQRSNQNDNELMIRNELISNELMMSKMNLQHYEPEISLMNNSMKDRNAIFNSELSNLQNIVREQKELQIQKSGFTEDEVRSYIINKISQYKDEMNLESMTLQAMVQSEGDVARPYKERYEELVLSADDSRPDSLVLALKGRLDEESGKTGYYKIKRDEADEVRLKATGEAASARREEERAKKEAQHFRSLYEESEKKRVNSEKMYGESGTKLTSKNDEIKFLESENERLRQDRNEHRDYCQQLYEEMMENNGIADDEGAEGTRSDISEVSKTDPSEHKSRISRKESDKVVVPPWPKTHDLDGWKSQLIANVLSACADPDQDSWIHWLGEAFKMHPDITGLEDSGGNRFATIDVKLANALNAVINASGDSGREVGMEIKLKTLELARKTPPKIMKGRQIIAMILESFRSSTQTDLTFTGKHLYELPYPGDSKLSLFKSQWVHILSAMREDDKPRDLALRDILFDKIKGSTSMAFDIRYYKNLREGHEEKNYEYLIEMINRTIANEREEKNRLEKAKGVKELLGNKALPAPPKKEGKPEKPTKPNNDDAAPVIVKSYPKAHGDKGGKGKDGKGKEKGKRDRSRDQSRPQSQDRKSIPCVFHFQKGGCSKGKDCPFSHSKKKGPRAPSRGPGNGKGGGPKNDRTAKGKCERSDCPYKHKAAPAETDTASAKAKASPKGKAKAAAAKAKSAAVVVEVSKTHNDGYLSDWSDTEESSPVAASKVMKRKGKNHVKNEKYVKNRKNPERIYINVGMGTRSLPKRNKKNLSEPRYVKKEFLESETFKHQAMIDHLVARAKAKVLDNDIHGRKPEVKVKVGERYLCQCAMET